MNEEKETISRENPDETPNKPGEENGLLSRWRRCLRVIADTGIFKPEEWPLRAILSTIVLLIALVLVLAVVQHGFAHVHENEVGVLSDNLKGELVLKERVGYHFFLPYLANFYVLDKTIQKLSLTWDQGPGRRPGQDVKLKASDGSDVRLDITVNYKLIPSQAVEVIRRCGINMLLVEPLVESYARHACLDAFGRLSSEDIYDAAKRNEMAQAVQSQLNQELMPHGIEVIAVIPGEFRFYQEYEQMIREKKLADQQVEEQQAQARAALEDQERRMIEMRKKAETRMAAVEGENANRLIQAQTEHDKVRREAEGQSRFTQVAADTAFYSVKQQAEGRKATLLAEAGGMEEMRKAMEGAGGSAMVELEYAKHLNNTRFTGTAITRQPTIQQFSVQPADAAAVSLPMLPAAPSQQGGRR